MRLCAQPAFFACLRCKLSYALRAGRPGTGGRPCRLHTAYAGRSRSAQAPREAQPQAPGAGRPDPAEGEAKLIP